MEHKFDFGRAKLHGGQVLRAVKIGSDRQFIWLPEHLSVRKLAPKVQAVTKC